LIQISQRTILLSYATAAKFIEFVVVLGRARSVTALASFA